MFCPNCGAQISDTTNFCPHCGAKTENKQPSYPTPSVSPPQRIPPMQPPVPTSKKSGIGKVLAVVIPVCTVVLAAVIVCTMLFLNGQNQPEVYLPIGDNYEEPRSNDVHKSEADDNREPGSEKLKNSSSQESISIKQNEKAYTEKTEEFLEYFLHSGDISQARQILHPSRRGDFVLKYNGDFSSISASFTHKQTVVITADSSSNEIKSFFW